MRRTLFVAALLVGLVLAGGVAAEQPGSSFEGDRATVTADNETNESDGFGTSVSSFVQSTTAETNGAVDQGMWEARVDGNATAEEAQTRAKELGERVAELRAERVQLAELRANGTISMPTYIAKDARLRAELRSLGAAANKTRQVGPNDEAAQKALESVEQAAEAARGPPDDVANRTGPPADVPGAGNGTGPGELPENASQGNGPPTDLPGNGSTDGRPPNDVVGNVSNGAGNASAGASNATDGAGDASDGAGDASDGAGDASNGAANASDGADNASDGNGNASDDVGTSGSDDSGTGTDGSSSAGAGSDSSGSDSTDAGADSNETNTGAEGSTDGTDNSSDRSNDGESTGSNERGTSNGSDPPERWGPKGN